MQSLFDINIIQSIFYYKYAAFDKLTIIEIHSYLNSGVVVASAVSIYFE